MLAVVQSMQHLYQDYDKVVLPTSQKKARPESSPSQSPIAHVWENLPLLGRSIGFRAISMSILGPVLYALFVRSTAWRCSLHIAAFLWDVPYSRLSLIPPYHISLIVRSFAAGTLLLTMWEVSTTVFSAYVAQEPIKKGQPLTSESSDPNGSLLIGLQTKREVPRVWSYSPQSAT